MEEQAGENRSGIKVFGLHLSLTRDSAQRNRVTAKRNRNLHPDLNQQLTPAWWHVITCQMSCGCPRRTHITSVQFRPMKVHGLNHHWKQQTSPHQGTLLKMHFSNAHMAMRHEDGQSWENTKETGLQTPGWSLFNYKDILRTTGKIWIISLD